MVKAYFGVGGITNTDNLSVYRVTSPNELTVIINHFDKYPLITQKRADYAGFKQIIEKINRKEHLELQGLKEILVPLRGPRPRRRNKSAPAD